jgi:hypothetical protein
MVILVNPSSNLAPATIACHGCGKKPPYQLAKANKTMALSINIIKFSNTEN